jgi:hypothetical protein
MKVIPFALVAACPVIRMMLDTFFSRTQAGFYGASFSLYGFFKNLYSFFLHFFNNSFEMLIALIFLVVAFGGIRQFVKEKRLLVFSCGIIIIGFMPYMSISKPISPYYITISLIGASVLFALGVKNIVERFPAVKSMLIVGLVPFFVLSSLFGLKTTKDLEALLYVDMIASQTIEIMKSEFPTIPEESLVYIENSTIALKWGLRNQEALRFAYNDAVTIFYEGVSLPKILPASCSGIYVLSFENDRMHFKKHISGAELQRFLTEKGF